MGPALLAWHTVGPQGIAHPPLLERKAACKALKASKCQIIQGSAGPGPCQATVPRAERPQWAPPQGPGQAGWLFIGVPRAACWAY